MNPATFNSQLQALGLTQRDAAKLCGVADRTLRTWASGKARIPDHAVATMTEAIEEAEVLVLAMVSAARRNPGVVPVYRTDEDAFLDYFDLAKYPAAFFNTVAARAQNAAPVGAITLDYAGDVQP